ncbi:MAG: hypothetical protein M3N47_13520 [Chloroflexota bacterium]|nr:hypothetical protein [Chloroflexota bacterium]
MSRLLARWFRRLRRLAEAARSRRRARKGVQVAPHWPRRRGSFVIQALVYLGGLLFVLWVGRALAVVISGKPNTSLPLDADSGCAETGFSCGVMGGIVMTLLSLALGSAIFLVHRLRHIRSAYVRHARNDPAELMPTAGTVTSARVSPDPGTRPHLRRVQRRAVRHELVAVKPADEPWQLIDIATTTRGERITTEVERFAAYETSDAVRAVADDILRHHPA